MEYVGSIVHYTSLYKNDCPSGILQRNLLRTSSNTYIIYTSGDLTNLPTLNFIYIHCFNIELIKIKVEVLGLQPLVHKQKTLFLK